MIHRRSSILIISIILVASFSMCSCSKSDIHADKPTDEHLHGSLWIEGSENVTLTYWIPMDYVCAEKYSSLAEHPFFKWMEDQTGVKVEFVHPSEEQMDTQFNMMLNSGEFCDLMFNPNYYDGPQAAIEDGVFADLNEFRDIMPNYFKAVSCGDGSFANWEWGEEKDLYWQGPQPPFEPSVTTVNGNVWCCTQVWTDQLPTECGMLIRQDWLDDAGLAVPQTLEELEDVLETFSKRAPDIIPMTLGVYGYNAPTGAILSAFGLSNQFTVTDGVIDPVSFTTPAFKEYLTLMHDWYQKGYIDADFPNRDYEMQESLLLSDRLGIFAQTLGTPDYYEALHGSDDPPFRLSAMPLPRMSREQTLTSCYCYDSSACNYTVIAADSKNKEIAAKWLDALFSKEAILRACYGVEGESFILDENGVPYYTDWFYNNPDYDVGTLKSVYLAPNMTGFWSARANALQSAADTTTDGQKTVISPWYETAMIWGQNANNSAGVGYVNMDSDTYSAVYDPYFAADTYAQTMVLKFIIGQEPLSNFESFAQKALDLGYREARNQMQKAYNKQYSQNDNYGM